MSTENGFAYLVQANHSTFGMPPRKAGAHPHKNKRSAVTIVLITPERAEGSSSPALGRVHLNKRKKGFNPS